METLECRKKRTLGGCKFSAAQYVQCSSNINVFKRVFTAKEMGDSLVAEECHKPASSRGTEVTSNENDVGEGPCHLQIYTFDGFWGGGGKHEIILKY